MSKVRLQDLTWVEAEEKMKAGVPVIVPFGSQEQHGPHAPMGDFIITEAVAVAAAERAGAIVAPVIAGGYRGFDPAALTYGTAEHVAETFAAYGEMGDTDVIVRHLAEDQSEVLQSLERLGEVRALLQKS